MGRSRSGAELRAQGPRRPDRAPADGKLALLDYKTGTVPKPADVEMGYAPQLPLEAAMAADGAFGPELAAPAAELAYWHLTGGFVPGEIFEVFKKERAAIPDKVAAAAHHLGGLVAAFDNPAQPYLSRPQPGRRAALLRLPPARPRGRMGAAGRRGMISTRDRAINEQLDASYPHTSAFVEASAGSGKTKLLTDRILRLMLAGADPGRIQCLTFTKAAAAEMALRLQSRLAEWATADNDKLDRALGELLIPGQETAREMARQLFARVLDLPGGMRIGTIHAFCQSLLRRFPLEAAVTPHFQLVEDADARMTMEGAREDVLAGAPEVALADLAGLASAAQLGMLVQTLDQQRDRLGPLMEMTEPELHRGRVADGWRAAAVGSRLARRRRRLARRERGPPRPADRPDRRLQRRQAVGGGHARLAGALPRRSAPRAGRTGPAACSTRMAVRRPPNSSPTTSWPRSHPDIHDVIRTEQARVVAVQERRRTLQMAEATIGLLLLALPMLRAYAARKTEAGLLDYTDLIGLTSGLLRDPGAAWVLYKLDGGIDHILLDEVQDTAPEQWQIAHRLTEEFFAGLGARIEDGAPNRSFFAVGDPKQSIYSFQGADPDEFSRSRAQMAARAPARTGAT